MFAHDDRKWPELAYGAVAGTVEVVDCVALEDFPKWAAKHPAYDLMDHKHVEGPYCIIVKNPIRFAQPVPYKGALGLWEWEAPCTE